MKLLQHALYQEVNEYNEKKHTKIYSKRQLKTPYFFIVSFIQSDTHTHPIKEKLQL